jgi:ribosomal 50S subunit-associated protein YjgA (DUF615 family)
MKIANTVYDTPQYREFQRLEKNLEDAKTYLKQPKWTANAMSLEKQADGEELTKGDKSRIKEWNDQMAEIKALEERLVPLRKKFVETEPLPSKVPAVLPNGAFGGNTNANRGNIRVIQLNPAGR